MAIIKRSPQDDLLDTKLRLLVEISEFDVDSALPPTDRLPQDRPAKLESISRIDSELMAMGFEGAAGYGLAV